MFCTMKIASSLVHSLLLNYHLQCCNQSTLAIIYLALTQAPSFLIHYLMLVEVLYQ